MKEIIVTKNESGYKLKKLCMNYLNAAPASFIHKMLRKKNIVLNDKKADGNEVLKAGDSVKFYMRDETIEGFQKGNLDDILNYSKTNNSNIGNTGKTDKSKADKNAGNKINKSDLLNSKLDIVYEDEDFIFCNKPVNVLSQKAKADDVSINEMILKYLLDSGSVTEESLKVFRPSVCNRLDRNTSGIILAAKTPDGARYLSEQIKNRTVKKLYLAIVSGKTDIHGYFKAYLSKDRKTNKVTITDTQLPGSDLIETKVEKVAYQKDADVTLLSIELITGKSHQIRAHLASLGIPIIGDIKYGNKKINDTFRTEYKVNNQALSAYKVIFPGSNTDDKAGEREPKAGQSVAGKEYIAKPDKAFYRLFDIDNLV